MDSVFSGSVLPSACNSGNLSNLNQDQISMTVLVVGSVALDSVETPFGKADDVLGGSATFFSSAASLLTPVQLVGVVGTDYPIEKLEPLAARGVDLAGLERAEGPSFR